MNINSCIASLIQYGLETGLIEEADKTYMTNQLLQALSLDSYEPAQPLDLPLEEILIQKCYLDKYISETT